MIDIAALIRELHTYGDCINERIDAFVNTAQNIDLQEILETIGEVDLSSPEPDLSRGWSQLRRALAYNALYQAVHRCK